MLMLLVGATHAVIAIAPRARADVLIRLQSGVTMRASSYWIDGDVVKFEHRGGIVGFARDTVVAIEDAAPLPKDAAPEKAADRAAAAGDAPHASVVTRDPAAANLIASTDPDLAPVRGEDLEARMARLDKLSLTTHRELTIARNQGQADEILDRLQHRIDEINRQRDETMQQLRAIR